jgi:hypothetical protein
VQPGWARARQPAAARRQGRAAGPERPPGKVEEPGLAPVPVPVLQGWRGRAQAQAQAQGPGPAAACAGPQAAQVAARRRGAELGRVVSAPPQRRAVPASARAASRGRAAAVPAPLPHAAGVPPPAASERRLPERGRPGVPARGARVWSGAPGAAGAAAPSRPALCRRAASARAHRARNGRPERRVPAPRPGRAEALGRRTGQAAGQSGGTAGPWSPLEYVNEPLSAADLTR